MAGYSKRSLVDKLGIKPGHRVAILNAPRGYESALGALPEGATRVASLRSPLELIQYFTVERRELEGAFAKLKAALKDSGALWVSWPKGASKVATDLNENVVREVGLRHGLVDVKVCAVDETWSGLKFVVRRKDRAGALHKVTIPARHV